MEQYQNVIVQSDENQLEKTGEDNKLPVLRESMLACIICSKRVTFAETLIHQNQNNCDLLELLCQTLSFPSVVPVLPEIYLPAPNSLFCQDCSTLIMESNNILHQVKRLEEVLERCRQQLKICIEDPEKLKEISAAAECNSELAVGPVIRKIFVQCWSNCKVDLELYPLEIPLKMSSDSHNTCTANKSRRSKTFRNRGRVKKAASVENDGDSVEVISLELERNDHQGQMNRVLDDFDSFDPNDFLAVSEDEPQAESDFSEEYDEKPRGKKCKAKRRSKISKASGETELTVPTKKDRPFKCSECGKGYRSQEYFDAHIMSHEGKLNFQCDYCDKKFALKQHLHVHNRQVHNVTTSSKGSPGGSCPYCGLKFGPAQNLGNQQVTDVKKELACLENQNNLIEKKELTVWTPEQERECGGAKNESECITNTTNQDLVTSADTSDIWSDKKKRVHMRECPENPRVKYKNETVECKIPCSQCDKVFTTVVALQFHIASIHKKTFKFYCEICARGFQVLSHLQRHIDGVHTMEKKFECETCHMKFKRSHQLLYHRRKHTGELPFICEVCGKGFTVGEKLRRHAAIHNEINRFPCHICGKLFKSHHYRHNHISTTHFGSRKGRQHKKKPEPDNLPTATLPMLPIPTDTSSNPVVPNFVIPDPRIYFGGS